MTEPGPDRQRLFFALWPDESVRRRAGRIARRWTPRRARRTPDEKLHITLAFVGDCDAERRACLEAVADQVTGSPFELRLDRVGHFQRPRVLWLGTESPPEALTAFHQALGRGLSEQCGVRRDRRPFHPHLTLGRKVARPRFAHLDDPLVWKVSEFCLVESVLTPGGAEYRVLRRWPLGHS